MFAIGFPVVFYLLYTGVLSDRAERRPGRGLTWRTYFMVSMATYGAIGAALGRTRSRSPRSGRAAGPASCG